MMMLQSTFHTGHHVRDEQPGPQNQDIPLRVQQAEVIGLSSLSESRASFLPVIVHVTKCETKDAL